MCKALDSAVVYKSSVVLNRHYLRARYYNQNVGRFTQMDTWMGVNHDPITLHKYLYANIDPVNNIDPTGNFVAVGFGGGISMGQVFAATAFATVGYGLLSTANDSGLRPSELGLLVIMAHNPATGSALFSLLGSKTDAKTKEAEVVPLFRAVEDGELASMYTCQCYSHGPSMFPKQFFHSAAEASLFGEGFIKRYESHYHLTMTQISKRLYLSLDRSAFEPGIGPIVTVPNGLLPAFNFDSKRLGGWKYLGTF